MRDNWRDAILTKVTQCVSHDDKATNLRMGFEGTVVSNRAGRLVNGAHRVRVERPHSIRQAHEYYESIHRVGKHFLSKLTPRHETQAAISIGRAYPRAGSLQISLQNYSEIFIQVKANRRRQGKGNADPVKQLERAWRLRQDFQHDRTTPTPESSRMDYTMGTRRSFRWVDIKICDQRSGDMHLSWAQILLQPSFRSRFAGPETGPPAV
ncbi:hypothetical protein FAVG1_12644 [Fusarium avenaceum]|nr:hypothetical protein FAVG1_12644 [Fusarium avenaceum]